MKKLKIRVLSFLLCACLIVPQYLVEAERISENAELGDDDILNGGDTLDGGDTSDGGDTLDGGDTSGGGDTPDGGDTSDGEDTSDGGTSVDDNLDGGDEEVGQDYGIMMLDAGGDSVEPETGAHGSGSYQLNSVPGDYRFYTEYFVAAEPGKSIKSAGIDRRTTIKVYAKAGEIILFGSSVAKSKITADNTTTDSPTGSDIVITTPDGDKISKDVLLPDETDSEGNLRPRGLGYIKNPTQEQYGPMVNHADENDTENKYYVPLQYQVTKPGVYTFEFHSVTGLNPKSAAKGYYPSPQKAEKDWITADGKDLQGNTAVAAWDVTVLGKNDVNTDLWEVKSGRAWADYLALTTADGYPYKSDLNVHVLTHDGYQYKVEFNEAMPYGFIFFANNTGFMSAVTDEDGNTTYRPIYHSFYDSSNDLDAMTSAEKIYLHKPDEADTATLETYKIFFNAPNDDLNGVEYYRNNRLETIRTKPKTSVTISDLRFNVDTHENIARTGHGGYFTFNADDEATVMIRLDLRKAIAESDTSIEESYKGSGIVEISAPAVKGDNSIYWDGKDTDGVVVPAGIYGDSNVVLATEIKRGELHFPVIDMEGLTGGLTVKRIDSDNPESDASSLYDLYYNNNPLVYGNIEGNGFSAPYEGAYYALSDVTKSYKAFTTRTATKTKYFKDIPANSISTLREDDKYYLAQKLFNTSFDSLDSSIQGIIEAELNKLQDTFHYEAVNSKSTTMKFNCEGYDGGGNQAGIDAWTYYTQGINTQTISFAVLDTDERGLVKGQIFYDANVNSVYDEDKDYLLSGVKVRLMDSSGKPLVHTEKLPCFDETGHFEYNADGSIKYEDQDVKYESVTDSTGTYRFTGVPFSSQADTTYYVQVMLSDVQSEVMRYTCTTSGYIQTKFVDDHNNKFITANLATDEFVKNYGPDGNEITDASDDPTKIYRHKYDRDKNNNNDIKFKIDNAQSVTISEEEAKASDSAIVMVKEFKKIGFSSTVLPKNQKDYKVEKNWGTDSQGNASHEISDGVTVELWVWNDNKVAEVNTHDLTRRTGALVDTQVLNSDNGWCYTWRNLDDRLQYYVLEYYTKKKPDGEVIYNDKGEARKVLIGGTMPIFGAEDTVPSNNIYGFDVNVGDYPETITVNGKTRIPIQKFGDGKTHSNALTDKEKLESVENNARQYNMEYTLSRQTIAERDTNVISMKNSQIFDDRAYYVWLNHETKLPEMISLTYVDSTDGARKKKSHPVALVKDGMPSDDGYCNIKGLSVSSVDSASGNEAGNATNYFRIKDTGKDYAYFTATKEGIYHTGTGTRTYQVKYVVNASDGKTPVSVNVDENGHLVETGTNKEVEKLTSDYTVYSWYMTIHVYDVEPDIVEYNPNGGPVILQKALSPGYELKWKLHIDEDNENSIQYYSINDSRTRGILKNDTYRLPLYKHAEHPDMGTCADIVGIAFSGSEPYENDVDAADLKYADTYESRYGVKDTDAGIDSHEIKEDGKAVADGSKGYVEVNLKTTRTTRINRTQDHANYADVIYTPGHSGMARDLGNGDEVFYYKMIVFAEDSTYQYDSYEDIDASEGVIMYTYFIMRPNENLPSDDPSMPSDDPSMPSDDPSMPSDDSNEPGDTSPKTGDENNLILWGSLIILAMAIIAIGIRKNNKLERD